MELALTIMLVQGALGAFDTLYFHEYVLRLPVHGPKVAGELRLHAFRDFVYGLLFLTLPFLTWQGLMAYLLCVLIALEICITIWDFNIEVVVRRDIGGVGSYERGLHLIMAVVYGFFLAHLWPSIAEWMALPTGLGTAAAVNPIIQILAVVFGIGVVISGIRDLLASRGVSFFRRDIFAALRK